MLELINGPLGPPKKTIEPSTDIPKRWAYSAKQKIANLIPEYSVVYPETSSDSASDKSKGILFPSARAETKKITKLICPING